MVVDEWSEAHSNLVDGVPATCNLAGTDARCSFCRRPATHQVAGLYRLCPACKDAFEAGQEVFDETVRDINEEEEGEDD